MRKLWFLFLAIILLGGTCSSVMAKEVPDGEPIYYFYENACGACTPEVDFIQMFNEQTEGLQESSDYHLIVYNVFQLGKERMLEVASAVGVPEEEQHAPLLIMGDGWICGDTAIREGLKGLFEEQILVSPSETSRNTSSTLEPSSSTTESIVKEKEKSPVEPATAIPQGIPYMRYYYRDSCPDCQKVKGLLERFEQSHPDLQFVRLDVEEPRWLEELYQRFEQFEIPKERYEIPAIFWEQGSLICEDITAESLEAAYAQSAYHGFADAVGGEVQQAIPSPPVWTSLLVLPALACAGWVQWRRRKR